MIRTITLSGGPFDGQIRQIGFISAVIAPAGTRWNMASKLSDPIYYTKKAGGVWEYHKPGKMQPPKPWPEFTESLSCPPTSVNVQTPPVRPPRRHYDGAQECWVLKGHDGAACITFVEPSETFGRCGHFSVTKGTFIPDHPTP